MCSTRRRRRRCFPACVRLGVVQTKAKNRNVGAGQPCVVFGCQASCCKYEEGGFAAFKVFKETHIPGCSAYGILPDRQVCPHGLDCKPANRGHFWATQPLEQHLKSTGLLEDIVSGAHQAGKEPGTLAVRSLPGVYACEFFL